MQQDFFKIRGQENLTLIKNVRKNKVRFNFQKSNGGRYGELKLIWAWERAHTGKGGGGCGGIKGIGGHG